MYGSGATIAKPMALLFGTATLCEEARPCCRRIIAVFSDINYLVKVR